MEKEKINIKNFGQEFIYEFIETFDNIYYNNSLGSYVVTYYSVIEVFKKFNHLALNKIMR